MQTPDWFKPEGWWCYLPIPSPPTNQKNVHELIVPCSLNTVNTPLSTPRTPPWKGYSLEGINLLWSPLPGKALFLSTSFKTLVSDIYFIPVYRSCILATRGTLRPHWVNSNRIILTTIEWKIFQTNYSQEFTITYTWQKKHLKVYFSKRKCNL